MSALDNTDICVWPCAIVVGLRLLAAEARVQFHYSRVEFVKFQVTLAEFASETLVFSCQYPSTNASYSFLRLVIDAT